MLGTDLIDPDYRSRNIANCLYRRGRMVEEWVVRDTAAVARQHGDDPDALARELAFHGFTGSMAAPAPPDVFGAGVSGARPDDHRAEIETVLELIGEVWNGRNLSRVDDLFDRDLVLNTVDDRTITRPEGYRRALLRLLAPFPEARFEVYDVATNDAVRYGGVRVAVTWVLRGDHNGALTLGENAADNAGLAIAVRAYRLSRKGCPAPVIDGFGGEQRLVDGQYAGQEPPIFPPKVNVSGEKILRE